MVLTVNEEKQRMWVVKADGSAITQDEYKKLGAKLTVYLGGPANSNWEIGMDHWDTVSPIHIKPVKIERENHEGMFSDLTEAIYLCGQKGYEIFGILEWKESGNWHDEHFRVQVFEKTGFIQIYKMKIAYEPYED